jgi:hypothetical protein
MGETLSRAGKLIFSLLVAIAACSASTDQGDDSFASSQSFALFAGTSFGMCAGYCTTTLEISPTSATLIETSRESVRQPTRTRSVALTPAEWQRIQSLVDPTVLASVAGVHGCPDCADGGAEWIELKTAQSTARVTFQFGQPPQPIAQLQAEIRAVRERFPRM